MLTLILIAVLGVQPAAAADPANLGHPAEVHCAGQDKLLADYYGLFDTIWIGRKLSEIDRWVDPDFQAAIRPDGPHGPEVLRKFVSGVAAAFPKRHLFNDVIVCAGDIVIARQTVVAINDGPFLGKPPSHVTTTVTWIDSYRFRDGRLWQTFGADGDTIGTLRQIGWRLVPPSGSEPVAAPIPWVDVYPYGPAATAR